MMLAFKAWKESQVRFLLSAAALLWFCGLFVLVRPGFRAAAERPYADFVAGTIYGGGIRVLYTIFVVVLGLGGLLPERAYGSVWFTLALPVRRLRLVVARAGVGVVQVAALACIPALAVSTLSRFVHETYPVADALKRSGQWAAAGAAAFGLAFLASVAVEAPFAALGISLSLVFGYALTMSSQGWLAALAAATAMVTVAAWITDRQDF
jgi:ABC-type transport system involved in multi-copper enzyme maturation permease subunit